MKNLFHPENPIMRFLSHFYDLIVLNFLFILSCIPVFTIGAAISATYCITFKIIDGEEPYIIKGYIKAFKENFKQATLLWLPLLLGGVFFGADLFIIYFIIDSSYTFLQFPVWIFIFILVSLAIYAFPLLSCYQCDTKQLLKNAVLLSIANFPTTVFIVVLHLCILYIASSSGRSLVIVGSLALFFGCAGIIYFCSLFLLRIFQKCEENADISEKK